MNPHWYLLVEHQARSGSQNMAVDQHLLNLVERGLVDRPILRTYAWQRPTLSLGYHQHWRQTVRLEALTAHGVDLVRRWTGGRAVLHDRGEITYSVVALMDQPFAASITHNYRLIGEALQVFTRLGNLSGNLNTSEQDAERARGQKHTPCFASLSQSEIETAGKKLIGSAQKLGKKGFLQHGSIPLIHRAAVLQAITGTELDMDRFMISLEDHYHEAGLALPHRTVLERRLVSAFATRFDMEFRPLAELGYPDEQAVAAIEAKTFAQERWTFRK